MAHQQETVLIDELKATGLPYEIAVGKKHRKIMIAGRLVGVVPKKPMSKSGGPNAMQNVIGQIRRFARRNSAH